MNSGKGNIILLTVISVATLLVSVMGTSSLLFSLSADKHSSEIVDSVGSLSSSCNSGMVSANIGDATIGGSNYNPGDVIAKKTVTISAASINSENLSYEIDLYVKNNTYSNGALVYSITQNNTNGIKGKLIPVANNVAIDSGSKIYKIGVGSFSGPISEKDNSLHTYTITVMFVNKGTDQSVDANKAFSAEIRVKDPTK